MGESLIYSWLRHIKKCQLVQTNWKVSLHWSFKNEIEIKNLFAKLDIHYQTKMRYKIFKKTSCVSQIIKQTESDALGIHIENGSTSFYTVDIAFHEQGLCYGTKEETTAKIIAKMVRTAFCLYGYFDIKNAEIIFAAPKVSDSILNELDIDYLNKFFSENGFDFNFKVIFNNSFNNDILQEVLKISKDVADTNELFLRSYQMCAMFKKNNKRQGIQHDDLT